MKADVQDHAYAVLHLGTETSVSIAPQDVQDHAYAVLHLGTETSVSIAPQGRSGRCLHIQAATSIEKAPPPPTLPKSGGTSQNTAIINDPECANSVS